MLQIAKESAKDQLDGERFHNRGGNFSLGLPAGWDSDTYSSVEKVSQMARRRSDQNTQYSRAGTVPEWKGNQHLGQIAKHKTPVCCEILVAKVP